MTSTRTIAKNTLFLTVGLFSGRILSIFIFQKMAGTLGPQGFGVSTLAIDVSTILLIIANFGLGSLITREVARDRTMTLPVMWAALRIRLGVGALCYAALLLYIAGSGFGPLQRDALLVMGLAVFLEASAMACDAVLQAHEMVECQMWGQIVSAVAYFGLAFWWLEAGFGVMGVVWANVAGRVVRLLVMVPLMLARTGPWLRRPPGVERVAAATTRGLARLGWPLFLSTAFGILYYKLDMPLLRAFRDEAEVGVFGLGHRALDILAIAPGLFATALFPTMVRIAGDDPAGFARISERSLRYLHLLTLPATLLFMFLAEPLTLWLAKGGEGFAGSVTVFRIVIWGMPFLSATTILNRMLLTAGRERDFVTIALAALATNLALNLALIPRWGYVGASVAVVATQALATAMHWHYIRRAGLTIPVARSLVNATGALAVAWLAAAALARVAAPAWGTTWNALPVAAGWGPTLAVIGLTAALYVPAMLATRALVAEDFPLLRQLARRRG